MKTTPRQSNLKIKLGKFSLNLTLGNKILFYITITTLTFTSQTTLKRAIGHEFKAMVV